MTKCLPFLLLFFCVPVFSQTKIQAAHYELKQQSPCEGTNLNFRFPMLDTGKENDARQIVNDSIARIITAMTAIQELPSYVDCDSTYNFYPNTASLDYEVAANTSKWLSFTMESNYEVGNGGHGNETLKYCFNIDIEHNKIVTTDNIFDAKNKKQLEKLLRNTTDDEGLEKLLKDYQDIFNPKTEYISYQGMTIADHKATFYFNSFIGGGYYRISSFTVPLSTLKKLMNKEYTWLCD